MYIQYRHLKAFGILPKISKELLQYYYIYVYNIVCILRFYYFVTRCEQCGSAFSQAAHLKNHAKVHSGEKPFKCDICPAAFADRFALKRHRGIHDKYGMCECYWQFDCNSADYRQIMVPLL